MQKMTKKQLFTILSNKNITEHSINYVGMFKRIRRRYSFVQGTVMLWKPLP